jgi:hypothetical protein
VFVGTRVRVVDEVMDAVLLADFVTAAETVTEPETERERVLDTVALDVNVIDEDADAQRVAFALALCDSVFGNIDAVVETLAEPEGERLASEDADSDTMEPDAVLLDVRERETAAVRVMEGDRVNEGLPVPVARAVEVPVADAVDVKEGNRTMVSVGTTTVGNEVPGIKQFVYTVGSDMGPFCVAAHWPISRPTCATDPGGAEEERSVEDSQLSNVNTSPADA